MGNTEVLNGRMGSGKKKGKKENIRWKVYLGIQTIIEIANTGISGTEKMG